MNDQLVYDGSFEGFLTVVFEVFEQKLIQPTITPKSRAVATFFSTTQFIDTDTKKSERVWKGLIKKRNSAITRTIYKAFLSEIIGVENLLLDYIKKVFSNNKSVFGNFTDPTVLQLSKIIKSIDREKHRMDAFIRFKLTKDNIYFAVIEPDFNVLPLLSKHFKNRYADQQWIIYDVKRKNGLYYDLNSVSSITLDLNPEAIKTSSSNILFTEEELAYEELWKNYFKSTNIKSRKNMILHVKHVPKRYWKYLSEKQL